MEFLVDTHHQSRQRAPLSSHSSKMQPQPNPNLVIQNPSRATKRAPGKTYLESETVRYHMARPRHAPAHGIRCGDMACELSRPRRRALGVCGDGACSKRNLGGNASESVHFTSLAGTVPCLFVCLGCVELFFRISN
ncbi:hypothetical protein M758_UG172400 [Ceratodon purpureus]|nr:hypothetical protein M758_UG172400 [Ceratodon purpureus]